MPHANRIGRPPQHLLHDAPVKNIQKLCPQLAQHGGVLGHLLVDMWDNILTALEDARSAVTITEIDYAKAFDRLSFQHCLEAFARKGASTETIAILATFLSNRTMSVRVGKVWSSPLPVYGGVPQGSILGVLVFNISMDDLEDDPGNDERELVHSYTGSETSSDREPLPDLGPGDDSDDDGYRDQNGMGFGGGGGFCPSENWRDSDLLGRSTLSSTADDLSGNYGREALALGVTDELLLQLDRPLNPQAMEFVPTRRRPREDGAILSITDELLCYLDWPLNPEAEKFCPAARLNPDEPAFLPRLNTFPLSSWTVRHVDPRLDPGATSFSHHGRRHLNPDAVAFSPTNSFPNPRAESFTPPWLPSTDGNDLELGATPFIRD